jgi:hypothetical protein
MLLYQLATDGTSTHQFEFQTQGVFTDKEALWASFFVSGVSPAPRRELSIQGIS